MNILVHFFLSGTDKSVIAGNFIADFVRGRLLKNYLNIFKEGIELHRSIDAFSDNHHKVKHSCQIIYPIHSHYSKVIIDILYDHFLSKNWDLYSKIPFEEHTKLFYEALSENLIFFTERPKKIATRIIETQWLNKYRHFEELNLVFSIFEKRLKFENYKKDIVSTIKNFYNIIEEDFLVFFPEICLHFQKVKK